ncbi:amidophosphoribosyltransferase [bacterium endosymbiont of Bathymodiolus sp. 5 South]|jgi:amidophosphoribosyltransferase|uniref:amidophosphoribosyltransferase n=1 Tax=bacterium endosymbiont of Bathymodiolus sp. 5 South TaxID=1181670 RepID=UPI0010B37595|nr:amidophosphoribosyltransferase [bacterium endosymbiont of Bathymodiolus sp. 5 South]CAC9458551.1 Amidophosphoribosyltransferase (EC 2.4.2.14) [uncultured Gammaproteobacteria bacterium]CAC9633506.1 Amidophosphoribosyltransferase (EC 2.4.2.14) [uncultured Gammaproteobacteria bacterium]CAC9635874.1 Amidophosphoribosyltransferase (EC 2.4.2.14) [uncultured Gammaproteobacteria bacterium]SHN90222.1 Amidophosphoribosyltransferase [bacterium endosymbiont of Bathymodiolus sp. 5 South]SSC09145.1 Amido
MCGIVGILSTTKKDTAIYIYDALTILQHRGQDAAGIVTSHKGRFYMRKSNGLVRNAFRSKHMAGLLGDMGIGHVRYPTAGSSSGAEAQPFYVNSPYGIAFAHNGNLTNTKKLEQELFEQDLRHINTNSDSEILLNVFAGELGKLEKQRINEKDIFTSITQVHKRVRGAYAAVGMIPGYGIFGFRDPNGIRPLILGKRTTNGGTKYMLASESVALTALGYEITRDITPGEAIVIDRQGNIFTQQCASASKYSPCIFEFVYFARPDSVIDNISVYKSRLRMGEKLAAKIQQEWSNEKIDVVIPIPDTSRVSALQLAQKLKVKYSEGLIKNRYIARTFIMPGQKQRKKSVRQKLSTIELEFKGKNVLLVDDSIVRGTTSQQIVQMARDAGAKKVFFASAAPAVRYPNVYGIDMASNKEFIAHNKNTDEVCQAIGADKLIYQNLDDLLWCVQQGNANITEFDCSCFNGKYVTGDIDKNYLQDIEDLRSDDAKQQNDTNASSELICNDVE